MPAGTKAPALSFMPMSGMPRFAGEVDEVGQLAAVGGVHRAGAHGEVVPVERDVAAAQRDDRGDDRSAVEVRAPVLVQDGRPRALVLQHVDALPHRHAPLGVLPQDRLDRTRSRIRLAAQVLAGGEREIVGALERTGRPFLGGPCGERIVERGVPGSQPSSWSSASPWSCRGRDRAPLPSGLRVKTPVARVAAHMEG